MKTIYKFVIEVSGKQSIKIPKNAVILSAQIQHETLCLWVELDDREPVSDRDIYVFGTGHGIDPSLDIHFIDTVQLMGGDLIFHVYYAHPNNT